MIITHNLAWYHVPKTAGTTTDKLFDDSGIELIWRDDQLSHLKHMPPLEHPIIKNYSLEGKEPIANIRRLPSWLLSNFHHQKKIMGLEMSTSQMRRGFFWRNRLEKWLPADWWLERFSIDQNWTLLRTENLKLDFLRCIQKYNSIKSYNIWKLSQTNRRMVNHYNKNISEWFSTSELKTMYAINPRWSTLEELTYGNLMLD